MTWTPTMWSTPLWPLRMVTSPGAGWGDGPSHIVLEALRGDCARLEDRLAYLTRSDDGKILKIQHHLYPR